VFTNTLTSIKVVYCCEAASTFQSRRLQKALLPLHRACRRGERKMGALPYAGAEVESAFERSSAGFMSVKKEVVRATTRDGMGGRP
jgi:hypothetical protein